VVLSVAGGTVVDSKAFAWDTHLRDFVPRESDSPELTAGRSGGN
jgi:hypothetical protein